MEDFFLTATTKKSPEGSNSKKFDPVIYENASPLLYVVMDTFLKPHEFNLISKLIRKTVQFEAPLKFIYFFDRILTDKELSKGMKNLFLTSKFDFSEYIPRGSKVLTIGRGLYSITKDTSMEPEGFFDMVWNRTHFYHKKYDIEIFPCDYTFNLLKRSENRLKDNFSVFHFTQQVKKAAALTPENFSRGSFPEPISTHIPKEEFFYFLKGNEDKEYVSFDTETSGLNFLSDRVGDVTLSFDGITGYHLNAKDIDWKLFTEFLSKKKVLTANGKFDFKMCYKYGLDYNRVQIYHDTQLAGHALNEMRANGLKPSAWYYTNLGGYEDELELYKLKYKKLSNYLEIESSLRIRYATLDAVVTYRVFVEQEKHMKEDPLLYKYYREEMIPTLNMFIPIEIKGAPINWKRVKEVNDYLNENIQIVKEKIFEAFGEEFNIDSAKQLGELLERRGWENMGRAKEHVGGYYLTNKKCLKDWENLGHPEAKLLSEYSALSSLQNTFVGEDSEVSVDSLNEEDTLFNFSDIDGVSHIDSGSVKGFWQYRDIDDRIHTTFKVMLAKSHRHRSANPNFQNIPHHGEVAQMIRSFFDSEGEDYYISEFDYSGLQARIACILSKDPVMLKIFTTHGDMHSVTSQGVLARDISLEEFMKRKKEPKFEDIRFKGKQLNFRLIFGGGAFNFAKDVLRKEWSLLECQEYVENNDLTVMEIQGEEDIFYTVAVDLRKKFFELYRGLEQWIKEVKILAKKRGYVRSSFGARRLLPQLMYIGEDSDGGEVSNLENISINSPVQNFEIVVISRAMRKIDEYVKITNKKSRMFVTVHDAIGFFIHKDEVVEMHNIISKSMEQFYPQYGEVPIEAEGDIAFPHDKEKPTYWGYGMNYKKYVDSIKKEAEER